jgi:predicted dehydrogenase
MKKDVQTDDPAFQGSLLSTRREFLVQTAAAVTAAAAVEVPVAAAAENKRKKSKNGALRLAIVGVGDISPRYFKQAAGSKRARFVATGAHHLESAKSRANEYGIPAWYDDWNKMYDVVRPDGVVIATPDALHVAPTLAAIERGIAVLCEKPMATTWDECQAMVAASQKTGTLFMALPYDATPPYRAALEHLNEATLGVFMGADAQMSFPTPPVKDWYYDRNVSGGWMLTAMIYPVSRLIGLLGPATHVTACVNTLIPHRLSNGKTVESNVDDNISMLIEWPSGQQALVRTLNGISYWRDDTAIYGHQGTLWLSGNDVIIHSPERSIVGTEPIVWNGQEHCYRVPVKPWENEGLIEHFVDCIQGVAQPTCSATQQLHVHEILFKGHAAARSGKAQELETTFTPWHPINPAFLDTRSRPL